MNPSSSLHARIAAAFDDQELRALCFDRFPAVYREFAAGMTHGQMIGLLLDYCVRHNAGDALLTALDEERPGLIGQDRAALLAWLDSAHFEAAYSPDKLTPALHQLRAPVGDFVGRTAEIAQLVQAARSGAVAAISGVRGMGGIGKTELAYVVAHELVSDFPDAQIVVELRGASDPLSPVQALQTIIRAFEREARLPDDVAELQAIYRSLLSGRRILILADDARDASQVRPLLPPPGCTLLVSSRYRFTLPGMQTIDLGTLAPAEAEALLLAICSRIGEAAPALAKRCGYLPLALRVSAGLLASDATLPVARYLEQLEDERTRLAALRDPDDPALDVEAVLALSYAALDSAAQAALCQLSVFVADFDLPAVRAVVKLDSRQPTRLLTRLLQRIFVRPRQAASVVSLLGDLYRRSLLDYSAAEERYSLHDLVRVFALGCLKEVDTVRQRYAQYYVQVAALTQQCYLQSNQTASVGLSLFDRERAHIDAGWAWVRGQAIGPAIDEMLLAYAHTTALIGEVRYDIRRERIPQLEAALAAVERSGRRAEQRMLLGNLGLAYVAVGEVRVAIDCYEQSLVIMREIDDRHGEGQMLGNLGNAYRELGEIRRAIKFFEHALVIMHEVADRRGEGQTLVNLGVAYDNLGDTRQAIDYYEQGLEIACKAGNRRDEGQVLGNLGIAYYRLGEVQHANDYHKRCLVVMREIGDRRGEGSALCNLGNVCAWLGEMQQAVELYEQSLVIAREVGDRGGEATALGNLGNVCRDLGEVQRAINYYDQQLVITRAIGDRQGEGSALGHLGLAYADLDEVQRAIDYYEQNLEIVRKVGDRRGEGNTLGNLAGAYYALGDARQAIAFYDQSLQLAREMGNRYGEGRVLGNLGVAYASLSEVQRAIELFEQQLTITREIGDWRGEGQALGNLGITYKNLGKVQQAMVFYEQQLVIARKIGDRQGEAIGSWNLGDLLAEQGDLARAITLMQLRVDYERSISHTEAETHAATWAALREQLQAAEGIASPEGDTPT